ncbi:hypothetical protein [Legionella maceachernii]|uniref:Uncharacterized protein n=1 Tax=Legionella maceachernii TaxID=466 RepID=A0A0W0WG09_9GAMM|nr:hypothetical protein [Legionella maceachernii]KTD31289.1 hypothetical protein Lmac_0343 [Legionella maceachernii]SKA00434.1 hypothetical protein SAMN02745128_01745 [Legionella maceachernii]SUP01337.1 Uncharacterised protein [Legionella maceachernii]
MGKTKEEILHELQIIENQVAEIEHVAIALLPLEFTPSLKETIQYLKGRCNDETVKSGHTEPLEAELRHLKSLFFQQTKSFFTEVAVKEKINWICPIENKAEIQPIIQVNTLLQSFKKSVQEMNESLLMELDLLKEKWESGKGRESIKKLEKISLYKEKISQMPNQLSVSREHFRDLYLKRTTRQAIIQAHNLDCLSDFQRKEITLQEVIGTLKSKFEKQVAFHEGFILDFSELDKLAQFDPLLKQWLIELKKLNHNSNLFIAGMRPVLSSFRTSIAIQDQLNEAILKMMDLNSAREKLRANILERQAFLQPTASDSAGLREELRSAKAETQNALEHFLMILSTIHLEGKTDQDLLFFTKKLAEFIKEIMVDLQAEEMHLPTQVIENFRIQLLRHLGEPAHWYTLNKPTINALDRIAIDSFLNELFASPVASTSEKALFKGAQKFISGLLQATSSENDDALLRKQIIHFRNLTGKLNHFDIKAIKDFHALKEIQLTQEKKIPRMFEEIASKLSSGRLLLQAKLMLFTKQHGKIEEVKKGFEIINSYYELDDQFKRLFARYKDKKQKLELVSSPLERLDQLTDLQKEVCAEFTLLEKQFAGDNGLYSITLNQILALDERYGMAKSWLVQDLKFEIEKAQEVLHTYYSMEAVKEALSPYSIKYQQLRLTQEINLSKIQEEVERLTTALKKLSSEVNLRLFEDYQNTVQHLIIQRFSSPVHFNDINPFKTELSRKTQEAAIAVEHVIEAHNALKSATTPSVRQLLDRLEEAIDVAQKKLQARDEVLKGAKIIEGRLQSVGYQQSILAIERMKKEYNRIVNKYVDAAIETYPEDEQQFEALRKIPGSSENYLTLARYKAYLDKIDPRLFKLLAMQFQFAQINKSYINQNLLSIVDEEEQSDEIGVIVLDSQETSNRLLERADQKYLSHLIANVNRTIHNAQMENLSDGILPDFVQWIRINILKPLQALTHQVSSYFKLEHNSHDRFFKPIPKTPWSSTTERQLVETGNEILDTLYSATAASAA